MYPCIHTNTLKRFGITDLFHTMCGVRKSKTLSQTQTWQDKEKLQKRCYMQKHKGNMEIVRAGDFRQFLGYNLSQQQLKLYFNLTCLAWITGNMTQPAKTLHSKFFEIIHSLKEMQSCISVFNFMGSPMVSCKTKCPDMQIRVLACRQDVHTIFGAILSRHK